MKKHINATLKSVILILVLTGNSLTAMARDSLESLRNDLNTAVTQINILQSQNAAQQTQNEPLRVRPIRAF